MSQKIYDLEDRTLEFAKNVRLLLKKMPKTIINIEDGKQVVRSSGSVGANYIEANESIEQKRFLLQN
jgi:four helix bundle protein